LRPAGNPTVDAIHASGAPHKQAKSEGVWKKEGQRTQSKPECSNDSLSCGQALALALSGWDLPGPTQIGLCCLMPKSHKARRAEWATEDAAGWCEPLLRINQGFDAVLLNLRLMRKHRWLKADQVRRFEEQAAEDRASLNSYLLEAIGTQETEEAGRLFRIRMAREHQEDTG
jgi:hypothetical protein